MPAQTVMRSIKSPAPMYKPTARRSRGGLHVPTTQNTEQTQQLRYSFLRSSRCLSLLKAGYQSRSIKATMHQNNPNMTRAFSRVKREASWRASAVSDEVLCLLFFPWLRQKKTAVNGRQHDLQDTSILGRQKQLLISELHQTYTRACWALAELCALHN